MPCVAWPLPSCGQVWFSKGLCSLCRQTTGLLLLLCFVFFVVFNMLFLVGILSVMCLFPSSLKKWKECPETSFQTFCSHSYYRKWWVCTAGARRVKPLLPPCPAFLSLLEKHFLYLGRTPHSLHIFSIVFTHVCEQLQRRLGSRCLRRLPARFEARGVLTWLWANVWKVWTVSSGDMDVGKEKWEDHSPVPTPLLLHVDRIRRFCHVSFYMSFSP